MTKLIIRSCFLLFLMGGTVWGQENINRGNSSNILTESRNNFMNLSDFSTDFVYTLYTHPVYQKPVSGKIMYKDRHFFIELGSQKIFCDGSTQWEYSSKYEEVRIFDHDPYSGIGLIFKIYLEGKGLKYLGEEKVGDRICEVISLEKLPANKYNFAKIWVDKTNLLPAKIFLSNAQLTKVSFVFSNTKMNADIPNELFHFDVEKHPNARIIDEREKNTMNK